MKTEDLKKANEIQRRRKELEKVREWMEDKDRSVYMIAQGCTVDESIKLSSECRALLYGLCLGEYTRLEKEFEEL